MSDSSLHRVIFYQKSWSEVNTITSEASLTDFYMKSIDSFQSHLIYNILSFNPEIALALYVTYLILSVPTPPSPKSLRIFRALSVFLRRFTSVILGRKGFISLYIFDLAILKAQENNKISIKFVYQIGLTNFVWNLVPYPAY